MSYETGNCKVYRVNDIFYSLQGEGRNTGRAAVFVRFAGCNLRCPFCDTQFESYREMTAEAILTEIVRLAPSALHLPPSTPLIVLTGGEPTLQVDETFVDLLHRHGLEVAMESNGTRPAPKNLDWLTVSPKVISIEDRQDDEHRRLPDELKIVFDENADPEKMLASCNTQPSTLLYLQPCDTGDGSRNAAIIEACVDYIKKHPQWRLSLQTHKLIGIE